MLRRGQVGIRPSFQLPTTPQHFTSRLRATPETLRKRAEARLLQALPEDSNTAWDNAQLVHELRVNQIELEMHNEELRHAYDEADALLERYADIYDFAPLSYFTLNRQGIIADLNLAGSILLGVKGSQKGRYRFDAHVAAADLPAFNLFFERVFAAKDKTVGEFELSANIYRPEASVKIEAVPDENGEECRMVVIDISAAKQAEKALRVREQYLRAVVDNFPFMVWLKDPGGRFLAVNSALASSFGWPSANTLIGKTDFDIASQELAERSLAGDLAVLQSGEQKTLVDLIEMNGEQRWFEIYKSPVNLEGEAIGTVGFAKDITERYNTQQALKNSEKQYRRLIEKMPLSIAILQDGILKYINPKGVELLGYPADECQGKSFLPLVYDADREWAGTAHKTHSLGGQTAPGSEIRLLGKTGQVIDCLMHVNSVEWEGRIAALAIFEDVTAKKRIEAELRRMASIDPLTELATRPHFLIHMEQAQSRLLRGIDREAAAVLLELDDFQTINDALGHLAGDATLRLFSALLRDELRRVDFAARIDHERFAVLLPESDAAAARVFAERLREKVAGMAIIIDDRQVSITVSIGIAALDIADQSPDDAFLRAEKALTRARRAGGDRTALARRAGQRAS